MPGSGTKQEVLTNKGLCAQAARVLDLTRSISRAGRRPTGVDRVELAYLDYFLTETAPVFGLVRTGLGHLLIDRQGLLGLQARLRSQTPWGKTSAFTDFFHKGPLEMRQAESDARRLARARCRPKALPGMLRRHVPNGAIYFNVGHTHLNVRTLDQIRAGTGGKVVVMIHDTIPLDFPEFQRASIPQVFLARFRAVQAKADLVICNSHHTQARVRAHMAPHGRLPDMRVAPLGVDVASPRRADLPTDLNLAQPYFVALGTIEPRKRHDLLLDVWEMLSADLAPQDMPGLVICGSRGWNNEAVFKRLDALPTDGPIKEISGLSDAGAAALLQSAVALLSPSEAEGYGLPPVEAAALGVLPVVLDLPAYRETLGNIAVYLNETDRYLWRNIVERLMTDYRREREARKLSGFVPPSWADHFGVVFEAN